MFIRHDFFIDEKTRIRQGEIKILVIGCGMGSQIAHLLVRSGFTNLTLCDGDEFEESNKNRQFCSDPFLNKNKAESLVYQLLEINPNAKLRTLDFFLRGKKLEEEIMNHDYIINTIDFDSPDFLLCSIFCRKYGKKEIFPINLGFDGCVCLFDEKSPTFQDYFKEEDSVVLKSEIISFLINEKGSEEIKKHFEKYLKIKPEKDPQTGISTFLNASIVCKIILDDLSGNETKMFPDFYYTSI